MQCLFIAKEKEKVYQCYTLEQIGDNPVINHDEFYQNTEKYKETQYIFSTWGMITLSKEDISLYFPLLKAVFYGAGSVKYFATPFLESGVRVFSAWLANAVPVSEFLMSQILLANKGYFLMHTRYKEEGFQSSRQYCRCFDGNYSTNVGFLGYGSITQRTIQLLQPFHLNIFVYSNHLTSEEALSLNITKTSMEDIFENCQTISNNMANTSETANCIHKMHFLLMKEYATFINTGRGAQVNLQDLKTVFQQKRNCVALIDVTDPDEPLSPDDDIWDIPNIFISPHSAGSISKEIYRMGDYMLEEFKSLISGKSVSYEVTESSLKTMA